MNILKLVAENQAKINLGITRNGSILLTVMNEGKLTQHQITGETIANSKEDYLPVLLESLVNTNKKRAAEEPDEEDETIG
jgi:hypothetical protein